MEVERRESRSRSRTPFLGDVVDTDNASTAEASSRVTRQTEKPKPTNGLTNGAQDKKETVTTVTTETVTVIETKAAKDSVNRSKAKAVGKKVAEKEVSNKKTVEKDTTSKKVVQKEESTKRQTASRKLPMDTDYSSDEEGKMRTISAYRAAGEWWETFPKTDYTYSPASRHRTQVVAPGVKALPNMSRRSLGSVGAGQHDSAFVSRTASARKAGSPPTLPYDPNWLRGLGHSPLSQMSDAESDDDTYVTRRTRTETVTTVTVWTRITTVVLTCLALADPRRGVRAVLDRLYLLVAYVRVLDARVLSALPWRPRRAWFLPAALLLLLLLAASWLSINGDAAPLDSPSALLVQWLAPISAIFRLSANEEPTGQGGAEASANRVTAGIDAVATPMPSARQQDPEVHWLPAPALDVSDVAAQVVASAVLRDWLSRQLSAAAESQRREASAELKRRLRDELASAGSAHELSVQQAVEDVGRDVASWRAEMKADWARRHEEWIAATTARVLASQPVQAALSAVDVGALVDKLLADGKLSEGLLADGALAGKILADGEFAGKLVADDRLLDKLLTGGALSAKLLADGELADKLLANGELVEKLLANGELADSLLGSGQLIDKLLASGELADKLVADGDLAGKLLGKVNFADILLANVNFADVLVVDGNFADKLLADGELSEKLLADRNFVEKLLASGELSEKLLADGNFVERLLAHSQLFEKLLASGNFVEKLLASGKLSEKLLASENFAGKLLTDDELADKLLADGQFVDKLLASGNLAEKLLADARFAGLVAAQQKPAEDERVTELQDKLALLTLTFETVRHQIVTLQQTAPAGAAPAGAAPSGDAATSDVEALVAAMIARYDADKTGRADFALESLGGSVLSTRCSETHETAAASLTLFGVPLWTQTSSPRAAIQPGTLPGQCWAFKGARGFLVVQLSSLVRVTAVSIEHTPRSLARNNRIDSAPRRFALLGLAALNDPEPIDLGHFEFLENGPSLQTFAVESATEAPPLRIVELQIESNHGNQEYTCLYRFRVHGTHVAG